MLKLLFNLLFILSLGSCTTFKSGTPSEVVLHQTKAHLIQKNNDSSQTVKIEIFQKSNKILRLEVSATLGYAVGSLLMTPEEIRYAIHTNKVFVIGPFAAKTLRPLFKAEIDPSLLWALIYNQPLSMHGFNCQRQSIRIESCKSHLADVQIEQIGELTSQGMSKSSEKKVTIDNSNIKMTWIFKSKEFYTGSQDETFVLIPPKEYKLIDIK